MIRLTILLILISTIANANYIQGINQTCDNYLAHQNGRLIGERALNLATRGWIAGWISGYNYHAGKDEHDEFESVLDYLKDYCALNPHAHLAQAMAEYEK